MKQKEWHETCKCKCKLHSKVCNEKQSGNDDKCRCECKELIDKGFIWNPNNCEYEFDKSCDFSYENCKCRERFVDKLVEEGTENVEEVKLVKITSTEHENVCKFSCTIYVVLFSIILTINMELVFILLTTNT